MGTRNGCVSGQPQVRVQLCSPAASPRPVCNLSYVLPEVMYFHRENPRLRWGWGLPRKEVQRVGVRMIQQLPEQLSLASWRKAALLTAEHFSLLPVL